MASENNKNNSISNILIIDDHQILIDGLRNLLMQHGNGFLITCAYSVQEAIEILNSGTKVDLALLDLYFPGLDGFSFLNRPEINFPVIVMSSSEELHDIENAIKRGAAGYLSKGCSLPELLNAIETALAGNTYLSEELKQQLAQGTSAHEEKAEQLRQELGLTAKNLKVLEYMSEGLSNKLIAEKLFVGPETIKTHSKQIYAALHVNNRLSAVNEGRRIGLIK